MIANVMHEEGHTELVDADIPLDSTGIKGTVNKTATHATGSSFQYARNYMMRMIFNIPTGDDDDDGNGAGQGEVITAEQLEMLRADLKKLDREEQKFADHLKVETLSVLPAKRFDAAQKTLKDSLKIKADKKKAPPVQKAEDDLKTLIANKNKELGADK
jgi:hypothetical protein